MDNERDPLETAARWLDDAVSAGGRRNPLAMAVATCDGSGRPSNRMVLLKGFDTKAGYAVFYTHYASRKGRELAVNARAAGVLYWEDLGRQLRLEGPVRRSPDDESDGYFATRTVASQLNAWVSRQSDVIADPAELAGRLGAKARELGIAADRIERDEPAAVARPAGWGGFRIHIDTLELWTEGRNRFHERRRFSRELRAADDAHFSAGPWRHEYLQP